MDPRLIALWTEENQQEALYLYKGTECAEKPYSTSESLIYRFSNSEGKYVLRVTPKSHRTKSQIHAEILWQEELSEKGIRVVQPVRNIHGELVQAVGEFLVCSFPFVEGEDLWIYKLGFEEEPLKLWAQTLARLHRDGKPQNPEIIKNRPSWETEREWELAAEILDDDFQAGVKNLWNYLSNLPREEYGLIHADLHHSNVIYASGGKFYVIDFDDSAVSWFLYDLAVIYNMFDIINRQNPGKNTLMDDWQKFRSFYSEVYQLPEFWWEQLDRFNAFRYFHLITFMARSGDINDEQRNQSRFQEYRSCFLKEFA